MASLVAKTPPLWGGIFLVIGNVVGTGILALPIAIAQLGLPYAIITLFFFWLLMTLSAYYFLEANLALPSGSNLISMSRMALGRWGMTFAGICNLLVLYSLISAYLAGGGDLIKINLHYLGISLPNWSSPLIFLLLFGFVISRGIQFTDHTNRILMGIKAVVFFVMVAGLSSYFNLSGILFSPQANLSISLLIIAITSFGFATLIPSLRSYYQSDLKKIKRVVFWGTIIPLLCYVIWISVIFSVIPYQGDYGLEKMAHSAHPLSSLQIALSKFLHVAWITQAMNIFSALCIVTSFLANSISLTDFIADALYKSARKTWLVYVIAYLPATLSVLFYQRAFLLGLSIAGTLAIIQLIIMPALMVWFLRNKKLNLAYSVPGGNVLLVFLLTLAFSLLAFTLLF